MLFKSRRNNSPVHCPMPTPSPSYPPNNYQDNSQLVYYHPQQSNSTQTNSSVSSFGSNYAQQLALRTQILGSNVVLKVKNRKVTLSQASVSSFCTDYVCNILANSSTLTCRILDKLAKEKKISIRHREKLAGNIIKREFATSAANATLSAAMIAALGDFSHFSDIIREFFRYTYTDEVTKSDYYSTHYYANDQYTITGCFLHRRIFKKSNGFKVALVSNKYTDTQYETACYLFTFQVAQATNFMENYLYGN